MSDKTVHFVAWSPTNGAPPALFTDVVQAFRFVIEQNRIAQATGAETPDWNAEAVGKARPAVFDAALADAIAFLHVAQTNAHLARVAGPVALAAVQALVHEVMRGQGPSSALVPAAPIPMVLHCPACGLQHIDAPTACGHEGRSCEEAGCPGPWTDPPHRSHLCKPAEGGCGHVWRPADVATRGVAAIATRGAADSPRVAGGQAGSPWEDAAGRLDDAVRSVTERARERPRRPD